MPEPEFLFDSKKDMIYLILHASGPVQTAEVTAKLRLFVTFWKVADNNNPAMRLNKPIKKPSLQKMVYETLRQAILEREIEPGGPINIRKLAEKLNVSTMPVREALRHLEAEGMVAFHSNKRIVAQQLSREDLYDIYAIRVPLEQMALLKFFDRKDTNGLRRLKALQRQMEKPGVMGTKWFNLNRAFHLKLYEMSGSQRLFQILQGLWDSTGPYLKIFSEEKQAVARANREHVLILEALREGDRSRAKNILRRHLRNGLKAIEPHLIETEKPRS
jgi:DNA-binding GntR family transcriptional regulator